MCIRAGKYLKRISTLSFNESIELYLFILNMSRKATIVAQVTAIYQTQFNKIKCECRMLQQSTHHYDEVRRFLQ